MTIKADFYFQIKKTENKFYGMVSKKTDSFKEKKNMKIKNNLKNIWMAVTFLSTILLGFHWFGYAPESLQYTIIGINILALILSAPCSLFAIPVFIAANHFLGMSPFSGEGIYLNTFLLLTLGGLQWFLLAEFWSPSKPLFQKIELVNGKLH